MPCEPEVLILGSRHDLTCDFVVAALRRKGVPYLRLNSEDLASTQLALDPVAATLHVSVRDTRFQLADHTLRSVLYRRPTFLRGRTHTALEPQAELLRSHWAAFLRNLMVFDTALWVNHPGRTYLAEHKALQLKQAARLGFSVPRTQMANTAATLPDVAAGDNQVVAKGLEPVLIRESNNETFGFTQFVDLPSLSQDDLRAAPVILQEALRTKTDLRVTVVGDVVFAVEITRDNQPIEGDWRCASREARYTPVELPRQVGSRCIELVSTLGLRFGAIDLALRDGSYYFLEINPTGEWAWLVDAAGLAIDQAVADLLASGS